jgi:Fe-S cluster biogenesis protein NfuA/nitrite reductase/ring-hydroxylating ferredoxin subunit
MDDLQARERVGRVEGLLEEVETLGDPDAREKAIELVGALLDLYGEGIARVVEHVPDAEALADDELVSYLLMLHGIHPVPVEARVRAALDEVRPYLASHGGNVELIAVEDSSVRLRMRGSCSGCPSSAMTLRLAIEDAIKKHAPEIGEVEAEDDAAGTPGLIQLQPLQPAAANESGPDWVTAGVLAQLRGGGTHVTEIRGATLLFVGIDHDLYAYRSGCPGCGASLEGAQLDGAELECPGCGRRFDAKRAGRSPSGDPFQLTPVPLLVDESGIVRVALEAAAA